LKLVGVPGRGWADIWSFDAIERDDAVAFGGREEEEEDAEVEEEGEMYSKSMWCTAGW
jgi:hypothetical protein